jgi:hypothetical protein
VSSNNNDEEFVPVPSWTETRKVPELSWGPICVGKAPTRAHAVSFLSARGPSPLFLRRPHQRRRPIYGAPFVVYVIDPLPPSETVVVSCACYFYLSVARANNTAMYSTVVVAHGLLKPHTD